MSRTAAPAPPNPWGLTARQCDVLDALAKTGCDKRAARLVGIDPRTVENHTAEARKRMGNTNRMLAVLAWDRFKRDAAAPSAAQPLEP